MENILNRKQSLHSPSGSGPLIIQNYQNGIYNGNSNKGLSHGKGVFWWDSGELYFGEWEEAKIHGEGIFFFPYGGYLKGFFFKNKINGAAFLKFPNGDFYQGFWRHGKLDGKCFKYFADFNSWALCTYSKGVFQKCLNKGRGQPNITFEEKLSMHIDSIFVEQDGDHVGVIYYEDGGKYYGVIQKGVPHGLGITYYRDGKFDAGLYQNGILQGAGRLIMENGDICEGSITNGQISGKGFFYKKDVDLWIFGSFKGQGEIDVLNKGQGFPLEEIIEWKRKTQLLDLPQVNIVLPNDLFYIPLLEESKEEAKKRTLKSPRNTVGRSQPSSKVKFNPNQKLFGAGDEYRKLLNFDVTASDSSESNKSKPQILSPSNKGVDLGFDLEQDPEKAMLEQGLEKEFEVLERVPNDQKQMRSSSLSEARAVSTNLKTSSQPDDILGQLSSNLQRVAAGMRLSLMDMAKPSSEGQLEGHTRAQSIGKGKKLNLEIQVPDQEGKQDEEEGTGSEYVYKKLDSPSPRRIDRLVAADPSNERTVDSKILIEGTKTKQESSPETGTRKNNRGSPSFDREADKRSSFFTTEGDRENIDALINAENPFKPKELSDPLNIQRVASELDSPEFSRVRSRGEEVVGQKSDQQKAGSPTNKHHRAHSDQQGQLQVSNEDSYSMQSISRSEWGPATNFGNTAPSKGGDFRKDTIADELEDNYQFQANKGISNLQKGSQNLQKESPIVVEERKYEADSLNVKANTLSNPTLQDSSAEFAVKENTNNGSSLNEASSSKQRGLFEDKEIQTDFPVVVVQPKLTPRKIITIQNYFPEIPTEQESKQKENLKKDAPEEALKLKEDNKSDLNRPEEKSAAPIKTMELKSKEFETIVKPVLKTESPKQRNEKLKSDGFERVVEENNELILQKNPVRQQSNTQPTVSENDLNTKQEEPESIPANRQYQRSAYLQQHAARTETLLKSQKSEDPSQKENSNARAPGVRTTQEESKGRPPNVQYQRSAYLQQHAVRSENLLKSQRSEDPPQKENSNVNAQGMNPAQESKGLSPDEYSQNTGTLKPQASRTENLLKSRKDEVRQQETGPIVSTQSKKKPQIQPLDLSSTNSIPEETRDAPNRIMGRQPEILSTSSNKNSEHASVPIKTNISETRSPEGTTQGQPKYYISPGVTSQHHRPTGSHDSTKNFTELSSKRQSFASNQFPAIYTTSIYPSPRQNQLPEGQAYYFPSSASQSQNNPITSSIHSLQKAIVNSPEPTFDLKSAHQALDDILKRAKFVQYDPSQPTINSPPTLSEYFGQYQKHTDPIQSNFLTKPQGLRAENERYANKGLADSTGPNLNSQTFANLHQSPIQNFSSRDSSFHDLKPLNNFLARSPNNLMERNPKLSVPSSNPKVIQNPSLEDLPPSKIIGPALQLSPERRSHNSFNYSPVATRYRETEQVPPLNLASFTKKIPQQPAYQGFRDRGPSSKPDNISPNYRNQPLSSSRNYSHARTLPEDDRSEIQDEKASLPDDNIFEKAPDQRPLFNKSVLRLKKEFPIPCTENPAGSCSQEQTSRQGNSSKEMSSIQFERKNWAQRTDEDSVMTDSKLDSVGKLPEENANVITPRAFTYENFLPPINKSSVKEQNPIAVYEEARLSRNESEDSEQNEDGCSQDQDLRETETGEKRDNDPMKLDMEKFKKYGQYGLSQIEENVDESVVRSIETLSLSKRYPRDSQEEPTNPLVSYFEMGQPLADRSVKEANQKPIFDFSRQARDKPFSQASGPRSSAKSSVNNGNRPQMLGADSLDLEDRKIIRKSPTRPSYSAAQDRDSISYTSSRGENARTSSELEVEEQLNSITEKARQDIARRRKQNNQENCIIF